MPRSMRLLSLFLFLFLIPALAFAASPWTEKTTNKDKILAKLDFGLVNTFAGWTELFTEPVERTGGAKDVMIGIGQGVVNAIADTGGGILHLLTFPFPQIDIPLPENGVTFE